MKGVSLRVSELWGRYKRFDDREAKKQLVLEYAHLVKQALSRLARGLSPRADINDLASSGVVGLMEALSRFEPERDVRFETYAAMRIRGAIVDHLRTLDWVPRSLRRQARAIEGALHALEHELERTPSVSEIAARMGVTTSQLEKTLRGLSDGAILSLDDCTTSEDCRADLPLRDTLRDPEEGPERRAVLSDLRRRLARALLALPERSRRVVTLYHFQEYTLRQVGALLDLSEASICQIHAQALARLRDLLHDTAASGGLRKRGPAHVPRRGAGDHQGRVLLARH